MGTFSSWPSLSSPFPVLGPDGSTGTAGFSLRLRCLFPFPCTFRSSPRTPRHFSLIAQLDIKNGLDRKASSRSWRGDVFSCMISAKCCLHFLEFFVKRGERSFVRDFFGPSKFGLFGFFFNRARAKKCKQKRQKIYTKIKSKNRVAKVFSLVRGMAC